MTRRALALYAAGALASGSAIVAAQGGLWWPASLLVFIGCFMYALADRQREYARAAREAQEAAERAARPPGIDMDAITAAFASVGPAAHRAAAGLQQWRAAVDKDQEQHP